MTSDRPRCIVIGVGNPHRGDDAAGPAVARQLRNDVIADPAIQPKIAKHGGEATTLILQMEGVEQVFLIDACVSGAAPGTIHRFDVSSTAIPAVASGFSSHGFGLWAAIELARALGRLPRRSIVYAIEGASFETGAPLSPAVAAAVAEAVRRLRAEITGNSKQASVIDGVSNTHPCDESSLAEAVDAASAKII
jgi:hydrogenase maturation protease